ncbi:MAG: ABC transporter substrate-binding protein [Rhodospirillaceae bacterium]|nr:ABC transporter substrate-binding protein [Rhodospirillaceae bacterium]
MRKTTLFLSGVAMAATAVGLAIAPAQAEDMVFVSWGGAYQSAQHEAFVKPFAKETGINVIEEEYSGEFAKIAAMVEANDVTWDVVDVDFNTAVAGCDQGIFEELDYSKIGQDPERFVPNGALDCAVGTIVYSTVYAYDSDEITENPPTTIADLYDLATWPGKRALQKSAFVNMEWALLADGVPMDEVYGMLETEEGIARAFAKLDTIKSEVVWWEAGAQPPQLLSDGEVVMASGWNGRFFDAAKNEGKNFVIVWDAQGFDFDYFAIPKGTPRLETAYKFLAFSSAPEQMAENSKYISYGPVHQDAIQFIAPEILKDLPTAPENSSNVLYVDSFWWADHREDLEKRFAAWLAQ